MTYNIDIDSYIGYPISKGYVRGKLAGCEGKPCTVRINSYGGDVQTALDIRQQFLDHGQVTAYIFGMTASAATILAMGAKRICMSRYALMLVHQCSGWLDSWGSYNADELAAYIKDLSDRKADLETVDAVIASLYALRSGKTAREMAGVMSEARWLTADECKALGLVDEIVEEGAPAKVTASMREHFTACGIPLPADNAGEKKKEEEDDTDDERLSRTFSRVLRSLLGLKPKTENDQNSEKMMDNKTNTTKTCEKLAAIPGLEGVTAGSDGTVTLTAAQAAAVGDRLTALEAAEATLKAEKAALEEQVDNLKNGDGDDTVDVEGEDGKGGKPVDHAANARAYLDKVDGLI